jgi:hypothetical protein
MPGSEMLFVYQFKVVLRGISPMIWRRLLLRSDHSIADLHFTIQIAMGWSDSPNAQARVRAAVSGRIKVHHSGSNQNAPPWTAVATKPSAATSSAASWPWS